MEYIEQPKTRQEKKGNKTKRNKELHGKFTSKFTRRKIETVKLSKLINVTPQKKK